MLSALLLFPPLIIEMSGMPVHWGFQEHPTYRDGFVSVGNFDGVHAGHCAILAELVRQAQAARTTSVVLTFEPHPIQILRPEFAPPRLTTPHTKTELILATGVEHVVVYPTDPELLELSAEEFFQSILVEHFAARGLVEGPNFFFGKDRQGTIDHLSKLTTQQQMSLTVVEPTLSQAEMISSSVIRQALLQGDLTTANRMLGRSYSISGVVQQGEQRGRQLGFPTANLHQIETLLPTDGVYAGFASIDGQAEGYPAAICIGPNPTFGQQARKVEAHLIGFSGDLYDAAVTLTFQQFIRPLQTFETAATLQLQLQQDIQQVIAALS